MKIMPVLIASVLLAATASHALTIEILPAQPKVGDALVARVSAPMSFRVGVESELLMQSRSVTVSGEADIPLGRIAKEGVYGVTLVVGGRRYPNVILAGEGWGMVSAKAEGGLPPAPDGLDGMRAKILQGFKAERIRRAWEQFDSKRHVAENVASYGTTLVVCLAGGPTMCAFSVGGDVSDVGLGFMLSVLEVMRVDGVLTDDEARSLRTEFAMGRGLLHFVGPGALSQASRVIVAGANAAVDVAKVNIEHDAARMTVSVSADTANKLYIIFRNFTP